MNDSRIRLSCGRSMAFSEFGDPLGPAVLYFHGAPGSRLALVPWETEFASLGLWVISPDRPGYGGSSPQPGRTLGDWPADVAELVDALGIDRFIVAGHSSGGPYAVVCAARLSQRVVGAVVLAGVTDMAWPPAWNGYFEAEVAMMRLPDEPSVEARCAELFGADGSGLLGSAGTELPEPDAALLADEKMGGAVLASIGEAFHQGVGGYAQDIFVQGQPWRFSPTGIVAPVIVAHGEADTIVPEAHSRHTAEMVPGALLRLLPAHGHLSISVELPGLCAEVLGAAGNPP